MLMVAFVQELSSRGGGLRSPSALVIFIRYPSQRCKELSLALLKSPVSLTPRKKFS